MDPLTHIILTRRLIGNRPWGLLATIGPDVPFYLTYPAWVIAQSKAVHALDINEWPEPPGWMLTLHRAFHSLPVAIAGAMAIWVLGGRWPRQELTAWMLHIAVDIPTHSREPWGPHFLWPLSNVTVDGIAWTEIVFKVLRWLVKRRSSIVLTGRDSSAGVRCWAHMPVAMTKDLKDESKGR